MPPVRGPSDQQEADFDEFEAMLTHPVLHSSAFYGKLRSLISRFPSFTLLMASRRSVAFLNQETQKINPHSSPYFNVFTECRLGALLPEEAQTVLAQAGDRFSPEDREFLLHVSGSHPYLLQLSSAVLWNMTPQETTPATYHRKASDEICLQTDAHFQYLAILSLAFNIVLL